jgi:Zn-dependent protease
VFTILVIAAVRLHLRASAPDVAHFILSIGLINGFLLFFNLLPIYPLDGGQIVRGLLWLKLGPIRSLKISSVIGFVGAGLFALWAISARSIWLGILAFFVFGQAQVGWRAAQHLALESEEAARREAAISPPPVSESEILNPSGNETQKTTE